MVDGKTSAHGKTAAQGKIVAQGKTWAHATAWLRRYGAFIGLILLILFNVVMTPNFVSLRALNINLTQVTQIVIVAVGMTLVIATGGIDLSVGALMAIAGALAPMIFMEKLFPIGNLYVAIGIGVVVPVIVAGFFGLFNGWLITRFSIQPIIATLVLFIAGRGLAQVSTNGDQQVFAIPEFQAIALGNIFGIPIPFQVWIVAAIAIIAGFILKKTALGREILAVGGNERAARLAGISVRRVKFFVYWFSGICAGLAGIISIAMVSASDANLVGDGKELDAIAAVAVGGTLLSGGRASVVGTVLGALIIQLVQYALIGNGVPDPVALVVKAGLILTAVWLQQQEHA